MTQSDDTTRADARPTEAAGRTPTITPAMEDYLKRIYQLRVDGADVATLQLAEELGFSGPSVTNMIKRLHDLKLVEHRPYHGVRLTPAGERVALEVVRHHRLLELYLAETLGYAWDEVHEEAERLEHHVSDELEARMDSVLGYPTHDPHGDPIPSASGHMPRVSSLRLSELEPGEPAVVARVSDRDPEQLRFLGELGLRPGVTVTVVERLPFDGPLRIKFDGEEHVIGLPLAANVNVATGNADEADGAA